MADDKTIETALQTFAHTVREKMSQLVLGEPEDQLRGPFENFMRDAAGVLGWNVVCTGETPLPGRLGRPDYAVHLKGLLSGYVELKAPGTGANPNRFSGHNREQWKRFKAIPNLLYTDGNEWALYRSGELIDKLVRLSGDIAAVGKKAVGNRDAYAIERILRDFFTWQPFLPTDSKGKINLKGFAAMLAPLCRMLRQDVTDALKDQNSPLVQLARDWRQLLFPDAPDDQFADAYAQTVAFALLLGRSEGADPLTLPSAEDALAAQHSLLSRALQVLTDEKAREEMSASLNLLLRVIAAVPTASLAGPEDPWLYFYEDFLAAYDPKLRKDAGAYYTPVEVVRAQVRLIDDLLVNRLGKPLGFADPGVITLDPAAGTGTYLLGVINHALGRIEAEQGAGAVPGQATTLAANLHGFELMVGPYAVTELRVSRALRDRGASLPKDGAHIYLTDTLESPHATPPQLPLYLRPIAEQHAKALKVKSEVPVIVCLGNPPYDRHEAASEENKARTGGWVRWGEDGKGGSAIFRDFLDPATAAGHGIHLKWLYNLYVYFWRWALWKVFEHEASSGPGVVSFITASSFLFSDAFVGMREHMRRLCDEIWILDLGGEGRGARKEENVFAIQTPVAIAVAVRGGGTSASGGFQPVIHGRNGRATLDHGQDGRATSPRPAKVHYARIEGTRDDKLAALETIGDFSSIEWQECPSDWQASYLPVGKGGFFNWPIIRDLFPWQHSGLMLKRTWPISPEKNLLVTRWYALLTADDRSLAFHGSGDREIDGNYQLRLTLDADIRPIAKLPSNAPVPPIVPYAYRSFDRQYLLADNRLIARPRTELWEVHGDQEHSNQLYLISQLWQVIGHGPGLTSCIYLPDFHHFKGSYGGKDVIPLYRTADTTEANILPGLLDRLGNEYGREVSPEDFLAYVYGALSQPAFTERFSKELETRELRVPITKDAELFEKVCAVGARLLWLHTYGERYVPEGEKRGRVPTGSTKCVKPIPGDPDNYPETFEYNDSTKTLRVGKGEFHPVESEVFEFEVSGLKVVQSWLKYRMKKGAGRKSSPLDDIRPERWTAQFTTELLELLWVLEATVTGYPEQAKLLKEVMDGPCFRADELPPVPDEYRKPPARPRRGASLLDDIEEE